MRYMLLIYADEQGLDEAERQQCYGESTALAHELHATGHYRALGFEEVMVRHITSDHPKMLRSFALIGQHIMPAIHAL